MNWIFEGIGTLLVGILLGAGGSTVYFKRKTVQKQRGGHNATQMQAGGDITLNGPPRRDDGADDQ